MTIEDEYNKHIAPTLAEGYTLDPPGYERLRDWTFLLFQIQYAKNELTFLKESKPKLYDESNFYEHFSRLCAAIVTYGRCFADSAPGMTSLDSKDVFKGKPDLKKVHDRMLEIRNGVFAHAGRDEMMRVTLAVREEPDGKTISVKHLLTLVLPYGDFPTYLNVLSHVEHEVILKINKYINHLETNLGKTIEVP